MSGGETVVREKGEAKQSHRDIIIETESAPKIEI